MQYLLGIDLGSSSIKVSIIEADSGQVREFAASPATEMEIISSQENWAEQHPEVWWENTILAVKSALSRNPGIANSIAAIGISYQMHGLVLVDRDLTVLRPSIIWCDSRAVQLGEDAYKKLGEEYCLNNLMNSPGNFTASKLKWVKENEPALYERIYKAMLPGDYLAMKLTGEVSTTVSGLSEGIMWDYQKEKLPSRLFTYYGLNEDHIGDIVGTFSNQGELTDNAAGALGLKKGTPITYRAGDQPNNAFSLNVLKPGEIAATAGTSGVIYGVSENPVADHLARINTFVHVNHEQSAQRYGILMCVNGTGIMNSWIRRILSSMNESLMQYEQLNKLASTAPTGSDGLYIFPFGNGSERILGNREIGSSVHGLSLTRHQASHFCRAAQEGIVFALGSGFDILKELNIQSSVIRAGHANMFFSSVFCDTFANVTGVILELYNTDGSQGAARGAGVGVRHYKDFNEAFGNLVKVKIYEPNGSRHQCLDAFERWKSILSTRLNQQ